MQQCQTKPTVHDTPTVAVDTMFRETPAFEKNRTPDSTVRIHPRSDAFLEANIGPRTKCRFCHEADSKYTCPRCNQPYCSANCFKSSNHAGCSESFYKDCLMLEMQTQAFTSADKLKVMKMIQDHERSYVDDEDGEDDSLQSRLEGVDLDNDDHLWTLLTAEEKADFQKSVDAGTLVEEWQPWWYYHDTSLITEIDDPAVNPLTDSTSIPTTVPKDELDIPKLPQLMGSKTPSPLVANNLTEVLYVYAYYTRKYNGTTKDFTAEFGSNLILSSTFLLDGLTRSSVHEAVQLAMEKCLSLNKDTSEPMEVIEILMDIYHILIGPRKEDITFYAKASIAESHAHCKTLKQSTVKHPLISRTTVKKVLKKLEFLYAWVDQFTLQLPILATEVMSIFKSKLNWHKIHEKQEYAMGQSQQCTLAKSQLIKEMT